MLVREAVRLVLLCETAEERSKVYDRIQAEVSAEQLGQVKTGIKAYAWQGPRLRQAEAARVKQAEYDRQLAEKRTKRKTGTGKRL